MLLEHTYEYTCYRFTEPNYKARVRLRITILSKWGSGRLKHDPLKAIYRTPTPSKVASQHQTELHAHGSTLAALLPDWLSPVNFSELASYIRSSWATRVETEDFLLLEQSPAKFPRMDHKWKLNSHPKPGMGALVTLSDSEAESEEKENSTSGSGD